MMTDPLADMLTRIRNAARIERPVLEMPASGVKVHLAGVLKEEGFIGDFQVGKYKDSEQGREFSTEGATLGDAHAYMSDGELTGTGVEIDVTVTLKVDRAPGFPNGGVVVETGDRWYTAGIGATWEDAVKVAWVPLQVF